MSQTLQAVRGMNDILPADAETWEYFEDIVRDWLQSYGYRPIRMPLVEPTPLFKRAIGEVTDIVEKEMYSFEDALNGEHLTLRPEGTAYSHRIEGTRQPRTPERVVNGASRRAGSLQADLAQKSTTLLANHPTINALKAQIDRFRVEVFQIRKPRGQGRRGFRNTFVIHDAREIVTLRKAKGQRLWPCPFQLSGL